MNKTIPLVRDTINEKDIEQLIDWLKTNPRLTKGQKTVEFENSWSNWLGRKYSVFVNSGSSANLAAVYSLMVSNRLKNKKIVFSCLSWVTTISPAIQLGLEPILCDVDKDTLGIDINNFEKICKEESPSVLMIVHALGFPNKMKEIIDICNKYGVILIEDSCECVGSLYDNKKCGNFGLISTFSTYFGHHFSTIEGGFVCTDDFELYNVIKSIRSHGWSRDLDEVTRKKLQLEYGVNDFNDMYTFYYPGFNLRSTDLQATIGINQLKKLDSICKKRYENLKIYDNNIKNSYWKINISNFGFISNFSYPIIHPNMINIAEKLIQNKIECRPLIAGNIANQPFYYNLYGKKDFEFANIIHNYGMYLPNNQDISKEEIEFICSVVNSVIG